MVKRVVDLKNKAKERMDAKRKASGFGIAALLACLWGSLELKIFQ